MKILYLLLALFLLTNPAAASQRFALVIGIDDYSALPDLRKARNDAGAVATSLEKLGYSVSLLLDPERRTISRGLSDMVAKVGPGDEVLFYFAGHGIQIDGRNYLIPADAPAAGPGDEAYLTAESVAVDRVLETLQSRGARTTVLILDACRDNPFPRNGTRALGGTRGLAPAVATEGSFILYSAGTGQTALDRLSDADANPNSVFTRNLLPFLDQPDRPLQEMVRSLRTDVESQAAAIGHQQRPAYYDELTGDYVLAAARPAPEPVAPPAPVAQTSPAVDDPCAAAARDWEGIAALNDPAMLRAFAVAHFSCQNLRSAALDRVATLERGGLAPAATPAPVVEVPATAVAVPVALPQVIPVLPQPAPPASEPAVVLPAAQPAPAMASPVTAPQLAPPMPDADKAVDAALQQDVLTKAVQTELKRLGCYRGGVDGDWGPGSRKALTQFYKVSKKPDLGVDPTDAVLGLLIAPGNPACPRPVAPVVARKATPSRTANPAEAARPAAPSAAAPAAAPAPKKKCGKLYVFPFPKPIDVC